jgi:hypothetical protein
MGTDSGGSVAQNISWRRAELLRRLHTVALAGGGAGWDSHRLQRWRQRPLPKGLMFGHIALAVAGLVLFSLAVY